jgi:hypothetical protein
MKNLSVSWQLSDLGLENNNITFGGNVENAFVGFLKSNFILSSSPWLFNLNYQGVQYEGVKIARNESFIYSSVDTVNGFLIIP